MVVAVVVGFLIVLLAGTHYAEAVFRQRSVVCNDTLRCTAYMALSEWYGGQAMIDDEEHYPEKKCDYPCKWRFDARL